MIGHSIRLLPIQRLRPELEGPARPPTARAAAAFRRRRAPAFFLINWIPNKGVIINSSMINKSGDLFLGIRDISDTSRPDYSIASHFGALVMVGMSCMMGAAQVASQDPSSVRDGLPFYRDPHEREKERESERKKGRDRDRGRDRER